MEPSKKENDQASLQNEQNKSKDQLNDDESAENKEKAEWYVLRVQSNKEKKVQKHLTMKLHNSNLKNKIFRVLAPTELISDIQKGFKRVVKKTLYPGYVIINMIKDDETYYFVKNTPGISDFAGRLSEEEIERVLAHSEKEKAKPKIQFHEGQTIKIKEGAFENYEGIVDEVNEQKGIVKVSIGIFGRYTQVELGFWQVESI